MQLPSVNNLASWHRLTGSKVTCSTPSILWLLATVTCGPQHLSHALTFATLQVCCTVLFVAAATQQLRLDDKQACKMQDGLAGKREGHAGATSCAQAQSKDGRPHHPVHTIMYRSKLASNPCWKSYGGVCNECQYRFKYSCFWATTASGYRPTVPTHLPASL